MRQIRQQRFCIRNNQVRLNEIVIMFFFVFALGAAKSAQSESLSVKWVANDRSTVQILAPIDSTLGRECFAAGLELEHRFLVKFCERVNKSGTVCGNTRKEVHNISYDPIQDAYRVVKDRLGDREDPRVRAHVGVEEAITDVGKVEGMPMWYVRGLSSEPVKREDETDTEKNGNGPGHKESLLGIRIRTTCKGETNRVFVDLSYFLSFGLIDLYGYDSGWKYFDLIDSDGNFSRK